MTAVEGFGPSSYSCNPATCTENCHCPSISAPGGLQGANIPQFVLITHDDAISNLANTVVRSAVDGFKNPNGCNVVATWFTTSTGTECDLAKKLYDENHEIALHTVHHASLGPDFLDMEAEMMNAKKDLMQCGIPEEEMVGFRAPYLVHNPKQRAILAKNKMLYDSSIIESISSRSMTTKNMAERLWPYSMDNGIVQDCTYTSAGTCSSDERYPGLWEVPLWPLLKDDLDKENNAYSMDPGPGFDGDVYQTLVTNFDQSYAGNRAPVPLFTHAPWFTDENVAASRKFIEYALSKGDVYFVTIKELLDWMKNPVSAQEYKTKANCKPVNVRPPVKKKCQVYIVQPGDYLASIAGKFGIIDVAELTSINPSLQVKTIQPGERINIPPWDDSCPPSASIEAITEPPGLDEMVTIAVPQPVVNEKQPVEPAMSLQPVEPVQPVQINEQVINQEASIEEKAVQEVGKPQGSTDCQIWTVAQGEFLEGIAKAAGATVQDIIDLNDITVGNTGVPGLSVGQQLKIPPYPECCVSLNCSPLAPLQNAPKTRVDIGLTIMSTSPIQNNAMEQIKAIIAEELDIPVGAISVAVTSRRRGRRLRQATTIPTSVVVSIATTTPVRLKQKITDELRYVYIIFATYPVVYLMDNMCVSVHICFDFECSVNLQKRRHRNDAWGLRILSECHARYHSISKWQ